MIVIASLLAALALELGLVAIALGGFGWLLLWPAASFLTVAFAYLTESAAMFGKVGLELRAIRRIVMLPYLASVGILWSALRQVERRAPWNHHSQGFLIGRRLLSHEYPEGVASIVDLTCEFSEILPAGKHVTYSSFPILDAGCPKPTEFRAKVQAILNLPRPVYVHCAQGHGRTALVAAAILLARGSAETVDAALAQTAAARPGARVNRRQRRALDQFAQPLLASRTLER